MCLIALAINALESPKLLPKLKKTVLIVGDYSALGINLHVSVRVQAPKDFKFSSLFALFCRLTFVSNTLDFLNSILVTQSPIEEAAFLKTIQEPKD